MSTLGAGFCGAANELCCVSDDTCALSWTEPQTRWEDRKKLLKFEERREADSRQDEEEVRVIVAGERRQGNLSVGEVVRKGQLCRSRFCFSSGVAGLNT
jgi:hypothetical protein